MSHEFYNDVISLLSNIAYPEATVSEELENETNLDNSFEAPEKLLT